MTGADMLTRKVRIEAEARGRAEGEARGRAEIVLKLLELKFRALSPEDAARVRGSSVETLESYAERVLSAESLGAVFGG